MSHILTAGPLRLGIEYEALASGGFRLLKPWWVDVGHDKHLAQAGGKASGVRLAERRLYFEEGYIWDGPSAPSILGAGDDFVEGATAHDGLYELIRAGQNDGWGQMEADALLYDLCRQDGMTWLRAVLVRAGLACLGWTATRKAPRPESRVLVPPKDAA